MPMTDAEFEILLEKALIKAAERDYMDTLPSENELDEQVAPSEKFRRKMSKLIQSPLSYTKKQLRPMYIRVLRTAATILLVISMLFGLSMLNPDVRARVVAFFREWFGNRTEYSIAKGERIKIPTSVALDYIPEDFELVFKVYNEFEVYLVYESNDKYFEINIFGDAGRLHIDNEHSKYYTIVFDDYLIDVYESNDEISPNMLIWNKERFGIIISITGTTDVNELILILENLEF